MIKFRFFRKKMPNIIQYKIIKPDQEQEIDYCPFEKEVSEEEKTKKKILSIEEIIGSEPTEEKKKILSIEEIIGNEPVKTKDGEVDYPFEEVITIEKKVWTPLENNETIQPKKRNNSIYSEIFENEPVLIKKK